MDTFPPHVLQNTTGNRPLISFCHLLTGFVGSNPTDGFRKFPKCSQEIL